MSINQAIISNIDGAVLSEDEHEEQLINDILTTPIGSRAFRRDYGSDLPKLIDMPLNGLTKSLMRAASAIALKKWLPNRELKSVSIDGDETGAFQINIDYFKDGVLKTASVLLE